MLLGLLDLLIEEEGYFDGVVVLFHVVLEACVLEVVEDAVFFNAIQEMLG